MLFWSNPRASSALAEYDQPWEICALCHSLDGNSRMAKFPKLAGQPSSYIQKQLRDFLSGHRSNDGGQMSTIVTEIDVADIAPIADWFASRDAPLPIGDLSDTEIGKQLFNSLGCTDCHGSSSVTDPSAPVPFLTAQHAQYLEKQLVDIQRGYRMHVNQDASLDPVAKLNQYDITELVTYLAATARD